MWFEDEYLLARGMSQDGDLPPRRNEQWWCFSLKNCWWKKSDQPVDMNKYHIFFDRGFIHIYIYIMNYSLYHIMISVAGLLWLAYGVPTKMLVNPGVSNVFASWLPSQSWTGPLRLPHFITVWDETVDGWYPRQWLIALMVHWDFPSF